jgi:hypothetical protein
MFAWHISPNKPATHISCLKVTYNEKIAVFFFSSSSFSIPLYVREFIPRQNLELLLLIMTHFNCRTIILSVCCWLSLYLLIIINSKDCFWCYSVLLISLCNKLWYYYYYCCCCERWNCMSLLRLFLHLWLFCRNGLLILSTKQMGIQFCDGPFIVRINLLISALQYLVH